MRTRKPITPARTSGTIGIGRGSSSVGAVAETSSDVVAPAGVDCVETCESSTRTVSPVVGEGRGAGRQLEELVGVAPLLDAPGGTVMGAVGAAADPTAGGGMGATARGAIGLAATWSRALRSAAMAASAFGYRSLRDFSSRRITTATMGGGTPEMGGGGSRMCLRRSTAVSSAENGGPPVSISYRSRPTA